MNIIHWNVGYNANMSLICEQLKTYMNQNFLCVLLEITPNHKEELLELLGDSVKYEYSLNYRKPGKFDGKNRKLGVLFLCNGAIKITDAGVFDRTLFPDRTLYVKANINGKELKVIGFHSITGCSHKTAKSTNFLSMAEAVEEFQPDIVMMDANEPKVDHYDISKMEFFNANGRGAKVFFEELKSTGLVDAYASMYNAENYIAGRPLAVSHWINGSKDCRYDFIFLNPKRIEIEKAFYEYDDAVEASADHAVVVVQGKCGNDSGET